MTQNSKQSQNNKSKIKSQSVTFTIAVMKKKEKRITLSCLWLIRSRMGSIYINGII